MEGSNQNIKQQILKSSLSEIFQILLHFDELIEYLLSDNFQLYEDTQDIFKNFILLLSCYKQIDKEIKNNKDKKSKINNNNFIDEVSKYIQNINNPIEILNKLFNLIHCYIISDFSKDCENPKYSQKKCEPYCIIHKLFFMNINEYENCSNCRTSHSFQMNPNLFIYDIKVNILLNKIKENNFTYKEISNNLFNISSMTNKKCSTCNSNTLEKNIIWYSLQKYFIISLNWNKVEINKENLIQIYCMINSQIKTQNESKEENLDGFYLFKGLLLKSNKNKYASLFYENKNEFRFYYFPNNKIFNNWNDLIFKLIKSLLYPIAIIYENKKNEKLVFSIEEKNYNKLMAEILNIIKEEKNESNINSEKKSDSDTPFPHSFDNLDWNCNKCGNKNNIKDTKCKYCDKNKNKNVENTKIEDDEKFKNYNEEEKKK
jgi:hypothetical protein